MLNSQAGRGLSLSMVVLPTLLVARKISQQQSDTKFDGNKHRENNIIDNYTSEEISHRETFILQVSSNFLILIIFLKLLYFSKMFVFKNNFSFILWQQIYSKKIKI